MEYEMRKRGRQMEGETEGRWMKKYCRERWKGRKEEMRKRGRQMEGEKEEAGGRNTER
jgi:hypothetical protein